MEKRTVGLRGVEFHTSLPMEASYDFQGSFEAIVTADNGRRGLIAVYIYRSKWPIIQPRTQAFMQEELGGEVLSEEETMALVETAAGQTAIRKIAEKLELKPAR